MRKARPAWFVVLALALLAVPLVLTLSRAQAEVEGGGVGCNGPCTSGFTNGHFCTSPTGNPVPPFPGTGASCTYKATHPGAYGGQGPFKITVDGVEKVNCPTGQLCASGATVDNPRLIPDLIPAGQVTLSIPAASCPNGCGVAAGDFILTQLLPTATPSPTIPPIETPTPGPIETPTIPPIETPTPGPIETPTVPPTPTPGPQPTILVNYRFDGGGKTGVSGSSLGAVFNGRFPSCFGVGCIPAASPGQSLATARLQVSFEKPCRGVLAKGTMNVSWRDGRSSVITASGLNVGNITMLSGKVSSGRFKGKTAFVFIPRSGAFNACKIASFTFSGTVSFS